MANYVEIARQFLAEMAQGGLSASQDTVTPAPMLAQTVKNEQVTCAESGEMLPVPDVAEIALSLKGHAVELWCDHAGGRVFIVADEEDAQEAIRRFGGGRGEVWIPGEIELVARFKDQAIRDEVAEYKRRMQAPLSPDTASKGHYAGGTKAGRTEPAASGTRRDRPAGPDHSGNRPAREQKRRF